MTDSPVIRRSPENGSRAAGGGGGGLVATAGSTVRHIATVLPPTLFVMVLLNVGLMAVAGWYLINQEGNRHLERLEIIKALGVCLGFPRGSP